MDHHADGDVASCSGADAAAVARILARAFADDPVITWMFGDPDRQRARLEPAFETWTRRIFLPKGGVAAHASGHAAACWAPPARWRLTVTQQLRLLPSMANVFGVARLPAVLSGMQRLAETHPDDRPHWYLGFLGTDPDHRRRGLATALLEGALAGCDRQRTASFLEASRSDNVPFYERFGFRVRHELRLPDGPLVWGMWRAPR